jgi:hypothetical protein
MTTTTLLLLTVFFLFTPPICHEKHAVVIAKCHRPSSHVVAAAVSGRVTPIDKQSHFLVTVLQRFG